MLCRAATPRPRTRTRPAWKPDHRYVDQASDHTRQDTVHPGRNDQDIGIPLFGEFTQGRHESMQASHTDITDQSDRATEFLRDQLRLLGRRKIRCSCSQDPDLSPVTLGSVPGL